MSRDVFLYLLYLYFVSLNIFNSLLRSYLGKKKNHEAHRSNGIDHSGMSFVLITLQQVGISAIPFREKIKQVRI